MPAFVSTSYWLRWNRPSHQSFNSTSYLVSTYNPVKFHWYFSTLINYISSIDSPSFLFSLLQGS